MKAKKNTVTVGNEKFIPMGIKTMDSKNRLTISERILKLVSTQTRHEEFQIFYGEEGDILLRPMVSIPARETWIYRNPKVLRLIRKGLIEADLKRIEKVENLDKFLEEL